MARTSSPGAPATRSKVADACASEHRASSISLSLSLSLSFVYCSDLSHFLFLPALITALASLRRDMEDQQDELLKSAKERQGLEEKAIELEKANARVAELEERLKLVGAEAAARENEEESKTSKHAELESELQAAEADGFA